MPNDSSQPRPRLTPQEALCLLMEGNRRFVEGRPHAETSIERRAGFAAGQSPMAAVLCCSDSRVTPEILFDQPLGEIFSVRVAGNFLNDDGLASLEFAVLVLGTPLIFVLGHTDCGAVKAALASLREGNLALPGRLPALVSSLMPAVQSALRAQPPNPLEACTHANAALAARNIAQAQPVIAPEAAGGRLLVVGGVARVETGAVELIDTAG